MPARSCVYPDVDRAPPKRVIYITGVEQSEVTEEKAFTDDLDVDSLSMVEIIYSCEEKFGVEIPDEESKNLRTVGDAVKYIEDHQS